MKKNTKVSQSLRNAIRSLAKIKVPAPRVASPLEQPFDSLLLSFSPLYLGSRKLYLEHNGSFKPSLISSPRTLSSPSLLSLQIEYSPIESEYLWAATDPAQSRNEEALTTLRGLISNLFHEQNHRILWSFLPPPPASSAGMRRYLNFVESLVVILDMALSDELPAKMAQLCHLTGLTYDPGTEVKRELKNKRKYRNYLHAALYGTYMNLEFYEHPDIQKAIHALFPTLEKTGERAAQRSVRLDQEFVQKTNPFWQKRYQKKVFETLSRTGAEPLELGEHPLDNRLQYLWTEKWLNLMGL